MRITKQHEAHYVKASGNGYVRALVSVFNVVDLQGDRVVRGAFANSLQKWAASGLPIPVVHSHEWTDPWQHIGKVLKAKETAEGLEVEYQLDVDSNPTAAQIFHLIKERRMVQASFAYDIVKERRADDGANELLELDILEVGPTLRGANEFTRVLEVKSAPAPTPVTEIAKLNARLDALASKARPRGPDAASAVEDLVAEAREERVLAMLAESHAEADFRRDQQAKIASRIPEFDERFRVESRSTEYESGSTGTEQVAGVRDESFRLAFLPGGMSPVEGEAADE